MIFIMREQGIIGDEVLYAAEAWRQVADLTETVSNEDIAKDLASVALSQFKAFHGLVNERLESIDEQSLQLIEEGQACFHHSSADELISLSRERQDLINFALSLYPEDPDTSEAAGETNQDQDIEHAMNEIREELGSQGLTLNPQEELILEQLLHRPDTELTKLDFVAAGFPGDYPFLFTGTMNYLTDKINGTYAKLGIEKVAHKEGGRTRGYKLVFQEYE